MEPTYQKGSCEDSARESTSNLILHQSLTPSPMDKPRELTKSYFEASNPDSAFPKRGHLAVGRKNYLQFYGAYGRLITGLPATRPSSWSMEQKPFSQVTYVTTHLEWQHM